MSSIAMGDAQPSARQRSWLRALLRDRTSQLGAVILLVIVAAAVLAPVIAPYDPIAQNISHRLAPPDSQHPFGTDYFGRDVLSRVIWGARLSLLVGVASIAFAFLVGTTLGMLAGYVGGRLEAAIMRFTDIMMSFPDEVLGIMFSIAFGTGIRSLILAIGILMTPRFIRLAHAPTLAVREREFVLAASALGAGRRYTLVRHVLPNIAGELLVMGTLWIGTAIRIEANLSFLGLGVSPPTPTWGNMAREGLSYLTSAWWWSFFPGLAILLAVLAFNLVGDALRDTSDPRLR